MNSQMRPLTRAALLLSASALSCGHTHNSAPAAAASASTLPSAAEQRPAVLEQTRPPEALRAELEKTAEDEWQSTEDASPLTAADAPPPGADSVRSFMAEHFVITSWVRDSIIDGKLEQIRSPLLALAEYSYDTVAPGGWMKGIAQLQAAARLTAQAQTLSAAASGIAAMGRVCGQCHRAQGGPNLPRYEHDSTTPKSDHLSGRMFRHEWAMERLWEGLVVPSNEAWQVGADALAHAPSAAPDATPALPLSVVSTLSRVRRLGLKANNADSDEQRGQIYGELLVTCADCHSKQPAQVL